MARSSSSSPVDLTEEFSQAYDFLENYSKNVFLTGKAGTGKSTFLQYFRQHSRKKIVVVAPTGVAALNVQGQTIHSLFRFAPGFVKREKIKSDTRRLFKEIDLLIIDEISMVRADVFDGIDQFLRLARHSAKPFGGLQLCLIGDLFQLSPVVSNEERAFFTQYYPSPFFFATEAYAAARFEVIEFSTVHRQNDKVFIGLLNAVRMGQATHTEIEWLNEQITDQTSNQLGSLILTSTNVLAETINHECLLGLRDIAYVYEGECKGSFGLEGARLPAPQQLVLKVGAQVMFVKNNSEGQWVNGTLGVIKKLDGEMITVETDDGVRVVAREKWKTIRYEFDEKQDKIVEKTMGTYTQFPLILAWAITIHKSQGKTLDRVCINLGTGAFAAGQLYVALSRCKSLSGITLRKPITRRDIRCDIEVIRFVENNYIMPMNVD